MIIYAPENLSPQTLLGKFDQKISYGNKFIKFSQQISKLFDRIIKIGFKIKKDQKAKDSTNRSAAVFVSIILRKIYKKQFQNYQPQQFIQRLKNKCIQICVQTKRGQQALNNIINPLSQAVNHIQLLSSFKDLIFYQDLLKSIINKKQLILNEQNLNTLKEFFKESIIFINYDDNKQAHQNIAINSRNIYLLKAKQQYFILIKNPEITISSQGYIPVSQLLSIFSLDSKVVQSKQKQINDNSLKNKSEINAKNESPSNKNNDESNNSNIHNRSIVRKSSVKQSILFPDSVKCSICNKNVSQFNALFWNYSHVCFQCIVLPNVDVSFIPSGLIQKFLRNHKYQAKQYHIICPQCKSQTFLSNYKPWQKPKKYKCKACLKMICIQHEIHISNCYCYCLQCDKQTVTVSKIFLKYCLNCRTRSCQICNIKGKLQCECICKICGQNQQVDHQQCKKRCHSCFNSGDSLTTCPCGKKLCSMCLFKSFQPTSKICIATNIF